MGRNHHWSLPRYSNLSMSASSSSPKSALHPAGSNVFKPKLESHTPPCPTPVPNHSPSTANSTLCSPSCPFCSHYPLSIPIALSLSTWVISYLNDWGSPSWCPSPLTSYLTVWSSMDTGGYTTTSLVIFFRNIILTVPPSCLKSLEVML